MNPGTPKMVRIVPISEEYVESFHCCLDSVAREKIYLAGVKARPLDSTKEFVLNNIKQGYPQYIALEGDRVVGWCDIIPMKGIDFNHCGVLGMGVHKSYRRKGIGSALLEATLIGAKEFGLERVELEVYTSNKVAIRMYEKYGFEFEGIKRRARKLEDMYFDIQIMALFLNR
ncbi:GNAT family N-acetyltransferase [Candidatus Bathyarchaeota archaeon]|nr:GNAT family N-acetyltransferase [Candidatus Bathyarchaeota archaeon]